MLENSTRIHTKARTKKQRKCISVFVKMQQLIHLTFTAPILPSLWTVKTGLAHHAVFVKILLASDEVCRLCVTDSPSNLRGPH